MAKIIVGLFDDIQAARAAIKELVDNDFPREDISLLANNTGGEYTSLPEDVQDPERQGEKALVDIGTGAALGGFAGLVIGLGALLIPGIGPVLAAGPIAAAVAGAGLGAAAGSLVGALRDLGIPDEHANVFAEGIRRGAILVSVQADDPRADLAMNILDHHDPIDIDERAANWREYGWQRFQEGDALESSDVLNQERARYGHDIQSDREHTGPGHRPGTAAFEEYIPDFRQHYETNFTHTTHLFEEYEPAYRFGYSLGADPTYAQLSWAEVEEHARHEWGNSHPDQEWDEFREAVRHGWAVMAGDQ